MLSRVCFGGWSGHCIVRAIDDLRRNVNHVRGAEGVVAIILVHQLKDPTQVLDWSPTVVALQKPDPSDLVLDHLSTGGQP